MANLYRKSLIDKLSSPEQLDRAIVVTSPMSWLALVAITLIIIATLVWSIWGTLPTTITVNGIIVSPVSTNAVYTDESGTVSRVSVIAGQYIQQGDEIIVLRTSAGERRPIYSTQTGQISEILVKSEDKISQGSELVRISPATSATQVVVCYVPFSKAPTLAKGMDLLVYPQSVDAQLYGHMLAKIKNIDSYAASKSNMSYVLGADNLLADAFSQDGAVVAVSCELIADATSFNGYYWSSQRGKKLDVKNGTTVSAKIITERNAPITLLFVKLKELWKG